MSNSYIDKLFPILNERFGMKDYDDRIDELYCAVNNLISDYEKRGIDRESIKNLIKAFLEDGIL